MNEDAELLINQARIFILKGRFEKAMPPLSSFLSADPQGIEAKSLLAACKAKKKLIPEAEKLAKEALVSAPASPYPHFALALIRAEQGKQQDASSAFEKAIASAPNDAFFYLQYSVFLKTAGKIPEALAAAEKAAKLDPEIEGVQALISSLQSAIPKKIADPLPEQGEIHNSWFYSTVPEAWSYSLDSEKNLHFFSDEQIPRALTTIFPASGTAKELSDLKGTFFEFVATDAGVKPSRMKERRMRVGNAAEAHLSMEEGGIKTRRVYLGYMHKDLFYIICGSCPEESFPKFEEKFDSFASSFLPRGVSPSDAAQKPSPEGHSKSPGILLMALSAASGLLGAVLLLASAYLLATSFLSGFQADMGAAYLFLAVVGYVFVAVLVFQLSPKSVYILHMLYFFLLAACAAAAYIAMGEGSTLGIVMLAVAIATAAASMLIALSALLVAKSRNKEFHEAYPEAYAMVKEKYVKSLP